ncbi:MAG: VWA domain-containing protein [Chloroflexi bacterium]|nr:VWA domain-containing protein [Chloroflexota bacterium]
MSRPLDLAPAARARALAWVAALACAALSTGASVGPAAAAPARQATEPAWRYEHVDTWENAPWQLTAGRFGKVIDISSTPDGTIWILDERHEAIHGLSPEGSPLTVWRVPEAPANPTDIDRAVLRWTPKRLDAGFDGLLYYFSEGLYIDRDTNRALYRNRVDKLTPEGLAVSSFTWEPSEFDAPREGRYFDIAQRADGRVYMARSAVNAFIQFTGCDPSPGEAEIVDAGIDVFSPEGEYTETIHFYTHGSVPFGVDVDRDGTLYAISTVPGVLYNPYCGPQPTEQPSSIGARTDQQAPERWPNGVAIFEPDHSFRRVVPFYNAEDIAVGSAGVFVSRNVEIFDLYDPEPMYAGPPGQVYAAYFGRVVFHVDVSVEGWVHGGMTHCAFQGPLTFERPNARPDLPRFGGLGTDAPELEGPALPDRIAAGEELAVLLGRYNTIGIRPDQRYQGTSQIVLPQTIQKWNLQGRLDPGQSPLQASQIGLCAGGRTWFHRDLAIDGKTVYSIDFGQLNKRPDIYLGEWVAYPGLLDDPEAPSRLSAVSAEGGAAAVLDEGTGKVFVVGADGQTRQGWSIGGDGNSIPVDIAMRGDRIYLADRGSNRVLVRDRAGTDLGSWPTHDGPESLAVGPTGDVFILGRGRWGYRYSPTGRLLASWPMPDRDIWSLDLTVDDDGKVYVSYLQHQEIPESTLPSYVTNQFDILRSGIWIFEEKAYERVPVPDPDPEACTATPDKFAAPERIWLGQTVDVTLTTEGRCPGLTEPAEVAIVFDTSRSMSFDDGLERAQNAAARLLAELDPRTTRAALVTFDDGATLLQPLTEDIEEVAKRVAGLQALGDTRSTAGISVAHRELMDRGRPGVRKILLLVTDGALKDDPTADAEAARLDGVDVFVLVTPTREYQASHVQLLQQMTGDASRVFTEPDPTEIVRLANDFTNFKPTKGLFETIRVVDEIPANMRYVANTAVPPAAFDPTANTLTWTFADVMSADGMRMRYTLRPLEVGVWPTNVQAIGDFRDALGNPGQLIYPIPYVEVVAPDSKPGRIYLPFLAKQKCFPVERPLDIVLVIDTSSSMREPTDLGDGSKLDAARAAAAAFVENLSLGPRRDQAAIAWFNRSSGIAVGLSDDKAALLAGLASLESLEGTRIDLGLQAAGLALDGSRRADAKPVVILLTDGIHNSSPNGVQDVRDQALALKVRGALIYTIGLGSQIQTDLLREVATTPAGYFASPSSEDLAAIYAQITEQIPCDLQGLPPDPRVLP